MCCNLCRFIRLFLSETWIKIVRRHNFIQDFVGNFSSSSSSLLYFGYCRESSWISTKLNFLFAYLLRVVKQFRFQTVFFLKKKLLISSIFLLFSLWNLLELWIERHFDKSFLFLKSFLNTFVDKELQDLDVYSVN